MRSASRRRSRLRNTTAELSGAKLDHLLKLMDRHGGWQPSASTAAGVVENLREQYAGPGFEHRDLSAMFGRPAGEVVLSLQRDLLGLVQDLFGHPAGASGLAVRPTRRFDKHGQRVYNEMYTGDKWNEDQEAWGKNDTIIYLMIWSDKMAFDKAGRQTGHPLTISLGNHSVEFQSSREGTKIAALLPQLRPAVGESADSHGFRDQRRKLLQEVIRQVLEPVMDASKKLVCMYDPSGKAHQCRVVLGAFLADLQEQWDALSLMHYPSPRCDVATLATRMDFTDPASNPAPRTEVLMKEVTRVALDLEKRRPVGWKSTYDALSKGYGFHPNQVAMWGFTHTDIYSCIPADTLHQCFNGMTKHLFSCLLEYISDNCGQHKDTVVCIVRDRLASYRRLHCGARIPQNSLWAIKTCGEENEAIMRFLGIALYGLEDLGVEVVVVQLFIKYARYVQLRDSPVHTTGSLAKLEELVKELQGEIQHVFPKKNWDFPKFFHMRKYAGDIRRYGMTELTTTGPKESFVKDIRKAWLRTNKKNDTYNRQVADKLQVLSATASLHATVLDAESSSVGADAQKSKAHMMGRSGLAIAWNRVVDTVVNAVDKDDVDYACAARMFRPCLEAFLKDAWEAVKGLHLSNVTVCLRRVAALYYEPYDTSILIRPASQFASVFGAVSKRTGVCDVTIHGEGDRNVEFDNEGQSVTMQETWYGRCLLLFTAKFDNLEIQGVYLRWFDSTKDGRNTSLDLQSLKWFKRRNDREAYGCVALESIIEWVCVVRITRKVVPGVLPCKKRKASAGKEASPENGGKEAYFVLNNLVGAFPQDLISIQSSV